MGKNIFKMRLGRFKVDIVGFKANLKKKKKLCGLDKEKKKKALRQENEEFRNEKLENQAGPDNTDICRPWKRLWILF